MAIIIVPYSLHTDWEGVDLLCEQLLVKYTPLLSPLNVVIVKLLMALIDSKSHLKKWPEALRVGLQLLKAYK